MAQDVEGLDALVVEDGDQMRRYLRSVLEIAGAKRVREARDGAEAIRLLADAWPDIVITDYQMEPVDGVELVRWIRRSGPRAGRFVPVIMVTASRQPAQLERVREAGVNLLLQKPVSPQAIADAVVEVLREPLPFIRTRGYFGPERRRGRRAAGAAERRVPAAGTTG